MIGILGGTLGAGFGITGAIDLAADGQTVLAYILAALGVALAGVIILWVRSLNAFVRRQAAAADAVLGADGDEALNIPEQVGLIVRSNQAVAQLEETRAALESVASTVDDLWTGQRRIQTVVDQHTKDFVKVRTELTNGGRLITDDVTGKVLQGSTKDTVSALVPMVQQIAVALGQIQAAQVDTSDPQ